MKNKIIRQQEHLNYPIGNTKYLSFSEDEFIALVKTGNIKPLYQNGMTDTGKFDGFRIIDGILLAPEKIEEPKETIEELQARILKRGKEIGLESKHKKNGQSKAYFNKWARQ